MEIDGGFQLPMLMNRETIFRPRYAFENSSVNGSYIGANFIIQKV